MKTDEIKYAVQNIGHRKMRSILTIVSILIGIASIYALVSFGMGIQNYVNEIASEAGVDKLMIQARGVGAPGTDTNFFISQDDLDFTERIIGVSELTGIYMKPVEISYRTQKKYNYLMGLEIDKIRLVEESFAVDIAEGQSLKEGDLDSVVLGYNYQIQDKVFSRALVVGDSVELNGVKFKIEGFYSEVGNPSDDANVYITKEAFEQLFPESTDEYGFALIRAAEGAPVDQVADRVRDRLRRHKGQEEGKEDFFVQTFEDALQTFGTVISIINGVLVLIALISLVVASVNIMNTMYTAVLERTKEIGVMKAIGATNWDIFVIFVFESGMLGLIGGVLGVITGYIIASLGGGFAAASGFASLQPKFTLAFTIGCILFSSLVGAVAGMLPAYRASKLRPVDALRYE